MLMMGTPIGSGILFLVGHTNSHTKNGNIDRLCQHGSVGEHTQLYQKVMLSITEHMTNNFAFVQYLFHQNIFLYIYMYPHTYIHTYTRHDGHQIGTRIIISSYTSSYFDLQYILSSTKVKLVHSLSLKQIAVRIYIFSNSSRGM